MIFNEQLCKKINDSLLVFGYFMVLGILLASQPYPQGKGRRDLVSQQLHTY